MRVAISALETQTGEDVIIRQAAIDALIKISFSHWFECGEYIGENPKEFQIINANKAIEVIEDLPSAQPDGEYISQQAVTESDLIDWYINSVDESEPVWTEEHIYELFNDFYLIPKENR